MSFMKRSSLLSVDLYVSGLVRASNVAPIAVKKSAKGTLQCGLSHNRKPNSSIIASTPAVARGAALAPIVATMISSWNGVARTSLDCRGW